MKLGKLVIIGVSLLIFINSVSAVWIYAGTNIGIVGNITLNAVTDQNFTDVAVNNTYINLSWNGITYYNLSFVNNIQTNIPIVTEGNPITITFDVYSPTAWTMHNINMSFITANDTVDSTETPTPNQYNSTHKRYTYVYTPSGLVDTDFGYFDVNISLWTSNTTLTYNGTKLFSDAFQVHQENNPYPPNAATNIPRPPANLSAYINGSTLDIYIYFVNMTPATDIWTLVESWSGVDSGRYEATNLSTNFSSKEFVWGNTTYTWSVNVTNGSTWTNDTYTYTTNSTIGVNNSNARFDVNNDNTIDIFDALNTWNSRIGQTTYNGVYDVCDNSMITIQDVLFIWADRE